MAYQPDSAIQPMAFTFNTLSKATSIGSTQLRAAAKAGQLKTRRMGKRHVILLEDAAAYLNSLPVNGEKHNTHEV